MADAAGPLTAACSYVDGAGGVQQTEVALGSHAWGMPLVDLAVSVATQALRQLQVQGAAVLQGNLSAATRTALLNAIDVFAPASNPTESLPFDTSKSVVDAGVPTIARPAVILRLSATGVQTLLDSLAASTQGEKATDALAKDSGDVDAGKLGLSQRTTATNKSSRSLPPTRLPSHRGVHYNDTVPWTAILDRDIRGLACHVRENLAGVKRYIRAVFFTLINLPVAVTALIAMMSVYISSDRVLGIRYRIDSIFVSFGVIFPLTFSIQAAFTRREQASRNVANLKANAIALYLLHRDWNRPEPGDLSAVGDNNGDPAHEIRILLREFLQGVRGFLLRRNRAQESQAELYWSHTNSTQSWLSIVVNNRVRFNRKQLVSTLEDPALLTAYKSLSKLSLANERILQKWGWGKPGEGPSARLSFALSSLITEFEQLQLVRNYRTPVMLRYGNRVLIHIMSVFLGPYFNTFCTDTQGRDMPSDKCGVSYVMAFLFTVIVNLLYNIGKDIEYPFDYEGMDDLFFDVDAELDEFTHLDTGRVADLFKESTSLATPPTDKNV